MWFVFFLFSFIHFPLLLFFSPFLLLPQQIMSSKHPIHKAAEDGKVAEVKSLLDQGASIDLPDLSEYGVCDFCDFSFSFLFLFFIVCWKRREDIFRFYLIFLFRTMSRLLFSFSLFSPLLSISLSISFTSFSLLLSPLMDSPFPLQQWVCLNVCERV